jgi:GAF domain-containing protein
MIRSLQRLIGVRYPYQSTLERQRSGSLLLVTYAALIAHLAAYGWLVIRPLLTEQRQPAPIEVINLILTPLLLIATYLLIQSGRLRWATMLFVGILALATVPLAIQPGVDFSFIALGTVLIAAGVLLGRRGLVVVLLGLFAVFIIRLNLQAELTSAVRLVPADFLADNILILFLSFGAPALLFVVFSGSVERVAESSVEDGRQFRLIGSFLTRAEVFDEDRLMDDALALLENDLRYTSAQIYLLDTDRVVVQRLRAGGIRQDTTLALTLSEQQALGEASRLTPGANDLPRDNVVIIRASDTLERSRYLTPPARIAALFPIVVGGRTVAILDVQSTSDAAFSDERLSALKLLANGLAAGFERAGTFAEVRRTMDEQEQLLRRLRAQLSSAQSRGEQLITEGWSRYLEGRGTAIGYDLAPSVKGLQPIPASDIPEDIHEVLARGEIHVEPGPEAQTIKVPILLRGEVIGAMSFAVPNDRLVTDRQIEMVRTVASRLAAALENNRLFEQTQSQALRERKANEVATQLLTATDVEALMALAAENFNEALGAVYTRITLEPDEFVEPAITPGNGHHANGSAGQD